MSSLRQQALKLLARREHSRAELAQKLSANTDKEDLASVLDQLEQTGLLSDQRLAEAYLRGHAARFGLAKLKLQLRAKGIPTELIERCLAEGAADEAMASEEERAAQVWRQKFRQVPTDQRSWAQQARFLQARGFSSDVIAKTLKAVAEDAA